MTEQQSTVSSQSASVWDEALALSVLGRLLQSYPNTDSLDWLRALGAEQTLPGLRFINSAPGATAAATEMTGWLRESLHDNPEQALQDLQFDHTRLFVGPGTPLAPPWESVHQTGELLLFQPVTRNVRQWYRRFGLAADHRDREPDDHLGLELAFLGTLAARAAEAADETERAALRRASSEFWQQHPGRWASEWAEQVATHARHGFNRNLSVLVKALIGAMEQIHGVASIN